MEPTCYAIRCDAVLRVDPTTSWAADENVCEKDLPYDVLHETLIPRTCLRLRQNPQAYVHPVSAEVSVM